MLAISRLLLALGASLLSLAVGAAQSLPPGMTMHRLQAGELDASGWTAASSRFGAFSVKLPCLFNDFTTQEQDPRAPAEKIHTLGCRRSDQAKFAAMRFVYKRGKAGAEEIFRKVQSRLGWETADHFTSSTVGGLQSVTIQDRKNGRCVFARYILAQPDVIALIVEGHSSACRDLRQQADKFFASLVLTAGG